MKLLIKPSVWSILFLLVIDLAKAQSCDPVLLPDSNQVMFEGTIYSTVQVGNKMYLGGKFTKAGKFTGSYTVYDTATGDFIKASSAPRVTNNGADVMACISDGAGGYFISGTFSQVGDSARDGLAHIDASGSITPLNITVNAGIYCLALSGNTLYLGGFFTTVNGNPRSKLAAIDKTTGALSGWDPNIGTQNTNNTIYSIVVNGSTIYVGGFFTTVGATARNNLAEISLSTGAATSWNPNITATLPGVQDIQLDAANSQLYIGGKFSKVGAITRNNIAAIALNTGAATVWNPNSNGQVNSLALNGTSLFAAGDFTTIGGTPRKDLVELSTATGGALGLYVDFTSTNGINKVKYYNNTLYVGGDFTEVNDTPRWNIAAIDATSYQLKNWTGKTDGAVNTIDLFNGRLYVGGDFDCGNIQKRQNLAAIDMDADTLLSWQPYTYGASGDEVTAMTSYSDKIYIGGKFSSVDTFSRLHLAAVDTFGYVDTAWHPDVTLSLNTADINAMLYYNNQVYIAGNFDHVANSLRYGLASVDAVSGLSGTWAPNGGVGTKVYALARSNDTIYIGGNFWTINATARTHVAATDAGTGALTSWNPVLNGADVQSLCLNNNVIYAGGTFTTVNAQNIKKLAAIDINTGLPAPWLPNPNDLVRAINHWGNTVYSAGDYSTIGANNASISALSLLDEFGQARTWEPLNGGNTTVYNISGYATNLYIAGYIAPYDVVNLPIKNSVYSLLKYRVLDVVPDVSITGSDSVCSGTLAAFTAATNVAGASYQWQVNNTNTGSNTSTFTYAPANADQVRCIITVAAGSCYTSVSDTSNIITMTVVPYTTPSVSIAGNTSICAGSIETYTSTTNVAGATYQWKVNNVNTGAGSTYNYTPANNDVVACTITTPAGCYSPTTATSDTLTIKVKPLITVTATISATDTDICSGTNVTYTATTNIAGGTYQWKVNNLNVGGNSDTLNYTPGNSDQVTCIITGSPDSCYSPSSVTTNIITMLVTPTITPSITISGPPNATVGSTVNLTASLGNAGPGYYIDWKNNNVSFLITSVPNSYYTKGPGTDQITATIVTPGCYNQAISNTLLVPEDLAVDNIAEKDRIKVYPNPFANDFYVSGLEAGTKLYLYDVKGDMVKEWTTSVNNVVGIFDTQGLSKGLYLLRVVDVRGNAIAKISVTRQ